MQQDLMKLQANGSNQMQKHSRITWNETLLKTEDLEADRSDMTEETPDSVETQTWWEENTLYPTLWAFARTPIRAVI